jgi:transcriptional regulator with PAS, ATPase and Fis domain
MVERVADTESTVLLRGESGTGKELIAKALHFNSRRGAAPFVPINCSALPEHLLESELFGHRKGAFTGAIADKKGLFHEADGGTIFLDEIGSMSAVLQSRLLRVLQEREVRAVGDNVPVYVNVRVIAATNEPLEQRIKEGTFREDLYYRLNVISIPLPPLRERREDIALLVEHLAARAARLHRLPQATLPKPLLRALIDRPWPGNVRELANTVERILLLGEEDELADEASFSEREEAGQGVADGGFRLPPQGLRFEALERSLIQQALERAQGQRKRAAGLLGMSYKTFLYRLEKHGLGGEGGEV